MRVGVVHSEDTAMPKLLILALLIATLVYPVGGSFFVSKKALRNRGGDESDHKCKQT
jgi:hypothetical protein